MKHQFYIDKTEKMLEDLLVKIHQDLQTNKVSFTDVELLKELNYAYFNQKQLNTKD